MTTGRPRSAPSPRVAGLRMAIVLTLVLAAASTLLAALVGGSPQVLGALVGAAIVGGFFLFGALSTSLAAAYAPAVSLLVALLTYTLQVVLLGLVFWGLTRSGATQQTLDPAWIAGVLITGTLVWMVALVAGATRTRIPVYELAEPAASSDTGQGSDKITVSREVRG